MKIKNLVLSSTAALALFAISATAANADTVTVKAGDTVSEIAEAHNTTVATIEKDNKLANVNLIFVGDKLEVNGNGSTTTATSAAASQAPQSVASQATSSAASTATSAVAPKTVASQATSSAATSAVTSTASQAASSASTVQSAASQATSSVATSQATSQASTTATSTSTSSASSYNGSNMQSYVLSQMESKTGVSASTWNTIISRESGWNSSIKNSTSGAYGLFQNMHISSGSVQDQVNAAVSLYNAQGMQAWAL